MNCFLSFLRHNVKQSTQLVERVCDIKYYHHHHHHHKHQGLDPMIHSVSRVTAARANTSSVFQLFSFLVTSPVLPLEILSWVGCPQDG